MFKSSLLALLASTSCVSAIAAPQPKVTPAPVLGAHAIYARQASVSSSSTTTKFTTTWGWYSGGQDSKGIVWAPITWTTEGNTLISSNGHVRRCTFSSTSSYISSLSSYSYTTFNTVTSCYLFTTCSEGWLVAATTSFFCVRSQSVCKTDLLYNSFGASDPLTWMYCDSTSSGASTITAMYKTKPDAMPATTPASTTSTPESSSSSATGSFSSGTGTPPPPAKSSNTGVIAGSVVGGVAVLAIAGAAILFLLRRNRKKKQPQNQETAAQAQPFVPPGYHSEKPPAPYTEPYPQQYPQQQFPPQPQQYNPHHSMVYSDHGSDIRPPNSPTPVYSENNYYRTELPANSLSPAPQTIPEHRP